MTFSEAKNYKLRGLRGMYSKYNSCSVDHIASTDGGLLDLGNMLKWSIVKNVQGRNGKVRDAVKVYLDDPDIKKDLDALLEQE
tara:strand:- start:665 stop:913 length:249 start_codon:yes stop_codon:yes gene_type:complete